MGLAASIKPSSRVACALLRSAQPEISPPPGDVTAAINVYRGSPQASSRAYIASLRMSPSRLISVAGGFPIAAVVVSSVALTYLRAEVARSARNSRDEPVLHFRRAIHRAQHHGHVQVAFDPKTALALCPRTDTSNSWHRCCFAASTSAGLNCGAAADEGGDGV